MVQRIERTTYRCRICEKIYSKMEDALDCERECCEIEINGKYPNWKKQKKDFAKDKQGESK